jgi:hypothetical protein
MCICLKSAKRKNIEFLSSCFAPIFGKVSGVGFFKNSFAVKFLTVPKLHPKKIHAP